MLDLITLDTEPAGRISLRIEIHQKNPLIGLRKRRRQIYCRRRLSDATLLICNRYNLPHDTLP